MSASRRTVRVGCYVALAILGASATGWAQEKALVVSRPKIETKVTADLADVGLAGQSTALLVTIAPGIMTEDHVHAGRNSLLVVVQGTLTEVRAGAKRVFKPGDVLNVAEGVTHHAENYGSEPLVYVEVNTTAKKP